MTPGADPSDPTRGSLGLARSEPSFAPTGHPYLPADGAWHGPLPVGAPPSDGHSRSTVGRHGHRRSRLGAIALALIVILLMAVAAQTYVIWHLRGQLTSANQRAAAAKSEADARLKGLEERTKELEQRAGKTLDAAAVAASVLPSVFLVHAGDFTGTAFAIGGTAGGGGTNLLTNYHVVDQVYRGGGRSVDVEQQNKRFTVRISKVDQKADLALLVATEKFPRLPAAAEPAKPGQPIVVVGAPLGLDDSVTSGVVSALRNMSDGTTVLQFDAAINPGSSGGPVVNAQKQVVGVVNSKARNAEGISLGIPVSVVCQTFGIC
jgi:putative serine protease PepD